MLGIVVMIALVTCPAPVRILKSEEAIYLAALGADAHAEVASDARRSAGGSEL
jgi:hypothetical protein